MVNCGFTCLRVFGTSYMDSFQYFSAALREENYFVSAAGNRVELVKRISSCSRPDISPVTLA